MAAEVLDDDVAAAEALRRLTHWARVVVATRRRLLISRLRSGGGRRFHEVVASGLRPLSADRCLVCSTNRAGAPASSEGW